MFANAMLWDRLKSIDAQGASCEIIAIGKGLKCKNVNTSETLIAEYRK